MQHTNTPQHRPGTCGRLRCYGISIVVLASLMMALVQATYADINVACGDVPGLIAAINTANTSGEDIITLAAECIYPLTTVNNTSPLNGANGLPVILSPITIHGNGSIIRRSSAAAFRLLEVGPGGSLTLDNLTIRNGKAAGIGNAGNGGGILVNAGGGITFNSVAANAATINTSSATNDGGGLYVAQGGLVVINLVTQNSSVASRNSAGRDGGGLYVAQGGSVSLQAVAINSMVARENSAGRDGGGVYIAQGGFMNIDGIALDGGIATHNSAGNDGGGIYIADAAVLSFQLATINNSTVTNNRAGHDGGGLYIAQGGLLSFQTVIMHNSPVTDNSAGNDGGGFYIAQGGTLSLQLVTVNTSAVKSNRAGHDGGGLYIAQDGIFSVQVVTFNGSAVMANRATNNGGGIFNAGGSVSYLNARVNGNWAGHDGGGVYNLGGSLSFTNSKINGNKAGHDGGGIFNSGGNVVLTDSTVHGNKAGHEGDGIFNTDGGTVTLNNSTVQDMPQSQLTFSQINEAGFGDPQINYAWSMTWFKGKLYVGLNKNVTCAEAAAIDVFLPGFYSTSPSPGIECAPTPQDLDLRAEIWRYTPQSKKWQRVFQSPEIPIPGHPGKRVALDTGYRGMAVFQEADGTEALYVSGVSSRDFNDEVPPPRILRSTDGITFEPVPQEPGTVLGDLAAIGFRSMEVYTPPGAARPRLYVIASSGLLGDGVIYEAKNPAGGNNNFRLVSPPGVVAFELAVFNNFLYIGGVDFINGYSVLKTDATGAPPYTFTTIVDGGAGRGSQVVAAISMHAFNGQLYVGANGWFPQLLIVAELLRINPDDSWELVVGNPRLTSQGFLFPVSGMWDGFFNTFNVHMWRMQEHQGVLYLGTNDSSVHFRGTPLEPFISEEFGADLWASQNGQQWVRITRDGFGDPFNFGIRTLASSERYGLFVGTASISVNTDTDDMGAEIWLGTDTATGTSTGKSTGQ